LVVSGGSNQVGYSSETIYHTSQIQILKIVNCGVAFALASSKSGVW
jgi:hypothetical protein